MLAKHDLDEPEESPRAQKRASPALSSDPSYSPVFSATATSPATASHFSSLRQLDPALFAMPDAGTSNYTTLGEIATSLDTVDELDEMEEMLDVDEMERVAMPLESADDYILSVTPDRSTAQNASGTNMVEFTPYSTASPDSHTSSEHERTEWFRSMSNSSREALYLDHFAGKEVELHKMRVPDLCAKFKDRAGEILQAYLTHTRFTVAVWANYDSVEKQLYLRPDQMESCGKLSVFPTQLERLEGLDPSIYQFMKVRLNIGTPFRTLFIMDIDSEPSGDHDGKWKLLAPYAPVADPNRGLHHILEYVIKRAQKNIEEDGLGPGQHGLTIGDLEAIAREFVHKPQSAVLIKKPSYANRRLFGGMKGHGTASGYSTSHVTTNPCSNPYTYFDDDSSGG